MPLIRNNSRYPIFIQGQRVEPNDSIQVANGTSIERRYRSSISIINGEEITQPHNGNITVYDEPPIASNTVRVNYENSISDHDRNLEEHYRHELAYRYSGVTSVNSVSNALSINPGYIHEAYQYGSFYNVRRFSNSTPNYGDDLYVDLVARFNSIYTKPTAVKRNHLPKWF